MTMKYSLMFISALVLVCSVFSCAAATGADVISIADGTIKIAQGVCTELPLDAEPEWIQLSCEIVGMPGKRATVMIPRAEWQLIKAEADLTPAAKKKK